MFNAHYDFFEVHPDLIGKTLEGPSVNAFINDVRAICLDRRTAAQTSDIVDDPEDDAYIAEKHAAIQAFVGYITDNFGIESAAKFGFNFIELQQFIKRYKGKGALGVRRNLIDEALQADYVKNLGDDEGDGLSSILTEHLGICEDEAVSLGETLIAQAINKATQHIHGLFQLHLALRHGKTKESLVNALSENDGDDNWRKHLIEVKKEYSHAVLNAYTAKLAENMYNLYKFRQTHSTLVPLFEQRCQTLRTILESGLAKWNNLDGATAAGKLQIDRLVETGLKLSCERDEWPLEIIGTSQTRP